MLLLLTQNMLFNLDRDVIVHLGVALRMFTRGIVLQSRVEDVQLGVQTYQRKLNLIIPQRSCPGMSAKELYTPNYDPQGVIYEDKKNRKILMWVDELHKFSEWSLQSVHKTLLHRLKNFRLGYNPNLICRGGNRQTRFEQKSIFGAAAGECGVNLINGICLNCTYGDGKPVTCCGCEGPLNGGFCSFCASRAGNSFAYDPNPNSFDDSQNLSDYPPQPQYQTYSCELCGNDAHYGYDCPPQVPFVYNQDPCYNQNYANNFPQTSPSFPQQYLCCENCGGPHATFQCQPMNQNFYNSNSSGFDQIQPPQYPVIHHPPQETSKEILQAKEDLMKSIQTFLKKFNRISFRETPKVLLLAWEKFFEIQHAQPEDIQDLLHKLLKDLQIIREELAEYIDCPSWNFPMIDDDDDEHTIQYRLYLERSFKAITPDLSTEEPDNSLSMGDEHLDTIPETESDEVIKSSVEDLVPIPSESEGIFNMCDVPSCDKKHFDAESDLRESLLNRDTSIVYSPKIDSLLEEFAGELAPIAPIPPGINKAGFDQEEDIRRVEQLLNNSPPLDVLNDHFEIFSDSNDDCTSSDDDTFYSEDIDYVEASPPNSELVSLEEVKNFNTEDEEIDTDILLTIKDDILREKLRNINLLIAKIETLNDNPTLDFVLKSHSSFPIPVKDSDFFLEKSETFFSLPELETFRFDIEEKNSGSTTVHADISLSEYDSFHFEIEPDQGELTRVVVEDISDNLTRELYVHVPNVLPTLEDRHHLFLTYVI
ncbi:hypothetical protein Tco_0232587 [Tanacetum coccineum]